MQGILANPRFLFRVEHAPRDAARRTGVSAERSRSRVAPVVLPVGQRAGRRAGEGRPPPVRSARRACWRNRCGACWPTLAPRRSATRFAAQWLRLQDVEKIRPDALLYPDPGTSRCRMRSSGKPSSSSTASSATIGACWTCSRRTIRSSTAARAPLRDSKRHGRRSSAACAMPENRRGILSHGSILQLTSVADRTSPVQRGKWIMQVSLERRRHRRRQMCRCSRKRRAPSGSRVLSVRERMEEHRANPACMSCHRDDRSARPGARELRRHRQVADQGQRRRRSMRLACCTTARRSTAPPDCARRS